MTLFLKEKTAEIHRHAERSPFQQSLVAGTLGRETYLDWLEQMLVLHESLENLLGSQSPSGFDVDTWSRRAGLRKDLAFWGRPSVNTTPLPVLDEFLHRMEHWAGSSPAALLGVLYVLEGSTNGSRFIARALGRSWQLTGVAGLEYLDPHGPDQPARWAECKHLLDRALANVPRQPVLESALATFDLMIRLGSALAPAAGSEPNTGGL